MRGFIFLLPLLFSFSSAAQDSLEIVLDSIIFDAMDSLAFPGAQVLILKDDSLVFHKAYGYHTYDKIRKVELNHLQSQ